MAQSEVEFDFWLLFHHGHSSRLLPDSPMNLDLNLSAAFGHVPNPGISFPDRPISGLTRDRVGGARKALEVSSPESQSVKAPPLMGPLLSALVFQDLVTMVEQLARFLGVPCDKAQLESLIEHCHQLVDQCCNAEALPVGRGTRPAQRPGPVPLLPHAVRCPPCSRALSQGRRRSRPQESLRGAPACVGRVVSGRCPPDGPTEQSRGRVWA